jgi:xanthine dehydrogenase YagR molybdenum-binding subunit
MSIKSVGTAIDRVDGRLKVTGAAKYATDFTAKDTAHAVLVSSTIAKGKIKKIDTDAALKAPGVLAVITHQNVSKKVAKLKTIREDFLKGGKPGEDRLPLADDVIYYAGQYVAVVVADSVEHAHYAADLVKVTYAEEKPLIERDEARGTATKPEKSFGEELQYHRGDADKALADPAAVKVEQTYTTPIETNNPMELSGTLAVWDDDHLTVYDATQWVKGTQATLAEVFNLPRANVHVICPYVGGGFGCKGFLWPHTILAAVAAKVVGRPVKLPVTRAQMFVGTGHRPSTEQKLALAATKDGKLTAIRHITTQETSPVAEYIEACGANTSRLMYACPNVLAPHLLLHVNIATPTPMRAPGENPGTFALESALDELAYALKMDPVELRLRNYTAVNPSNDKPWSSNHLKDCYRIGAEMFGWKDRKPEPRSMRDGKLLVGWGMATATYPGHRFPASAMAHINADGRGGAVCATQDLGTGAYTVFAQTTADALGLPVEKVTFELGDSALPTGPVSGGSNSTASVSQAVVEAGAAALAKLIALALDHEKSPLHGLRAKEVSASDGRLFATDDPKRGETYTEVLRRAGKDSVEAESATKLSEEQQKKFAFQSFGVQFCEVKVDEPLGRVRVTRWAGAFDPGRVMNPKTCRSQVLGGVVLGIGMALTEHTVYDPRTGRPVTDNLADYAVAVNADVPEIKVHFIDKPDPEINALGCRGIGEIAITGVAPGIANAIYHATGKRIRDLPITPDKLL